ncbi:MAG TPA: hypothetical protein VFQ42_22020 [Mycobacterium sp.]|nr:hypothetical protein [Mycobacterium sp.]
MIRTLATALLVGLAIAGLLAVIRGDAHRLERWPSTYLARADSEPHVVGPYQPCRPSGAAVLRADARQIRRVEVVHDTLTIDATAIPVSFRTSAPAWAAGTWIGARVYRDDGAQWTYVVQRDAEEYELVVLRSVAGAACTDAVAVGMRRVES